MKRVELHRSEARNVVISEGVKIRTFVVVVFSMFVLILFNLLLKRFLPKLALRQGELVVIYVMLSVTSAIAGHSTLEILIPILGHAFWFATPENDWSNLFWRYIPKWLSVDDKKVLLGYYEGDSTLYMPQHILGWLTPIMSWFAFALALFFVMVCINVILRKLPIELERMGAGPAIEKTLCWRQETVISRNDQTGRHQEREREGENR